MPDATDGSRIHGMEAVAHGHNVYFITLRELLDEPAREVQENSLGERPGGASWLRTLRMSCPSLL